MLNKHFNAAGTGSNGLKELTSLYNYFVGTSTAEKQTFLLTDMIASRYELLT
jgi:hypothetical protein